jgi:two-component system, NtrC family, sensor kinase
VFPQIDLREGAATGPAASAEAPVGRDLGSEPNWRVLVVDDNPAIHDDFRKILESNAGSNEIDELAAQVFGTTMPSPSRSFVVHSAHQGEEALERVRAARCEGTPYALAFMDVRMPPGWDGVKTTAHVLEADPEIAVVICTAYSDHGWDDMARAFGQTDRVLILKKPFDTIEVRQLAHTLRRRWELGRHASLRLEEMEALVRKRTEELSAANEELRKEAAARARVEVELRLSHKLEAVGQLAAGVAHEINTPVQFASDSVHFLCDALADFAQVLEKYRALQRAVVAGTPAQEAAVEVARAEEQADLPYLIENVPLALERSLEGLNRVADIVRAMKEFAQPGHKEMTAVDLNRAIDNTLIISKKEYKHVADVERDFGELPPVTCHISDLNQALLHIIVNAAHAVADVVRGTENRGRISVRSRCEDDWVTIAIEDTGTGIAPAIRDRIFDPFFTTKEVGTGTGQGLSVARSVICERHGGELTFESELGKGTTFVLRLPVDGQQRPAARP